jgi:hypothetical protein
MDKTTKAKVLGLIQLAHKDNTSVNVSQKLQELYLEILDIPTQPKQQPAYATAVQFMLLIGTFSIGLVVCYIVMSLSQ